MRLNQLLLLLLGLGLAMPAVAQDRPADIADIWMVVVKDGHDKEFEKAFKNHLKYRKGKDDTRAWKTYAPIIGEDMDHYAIRYCCTTYAEMDDYQAWSQNAGTVDHWNENVDPHVAHYEHYFDRLDLKNSNWPEDDPGYRMFGVTSWKAKSGRGAAVSASKAEISNAAKKGGWPRSWSWANTIGGDGELILVAPYMNYADMEGPEGGFSAFLAQQIGADEATAMLGRFSDNFESSNYSVYRLVDELSMSD